MRLRNVFAVASVSLVLLSNSLLAVFFFRYISTQIRETAYAASSGTALQASVNFDDRIRGILNRILALRSHDQFGYNSAFGKFLFHEEAPYYALAQTEMAGILAELRVSDPFIHSVYVYTPKGDFHDFVRLKKAGYSFTRTGLYREILSAGDKPVIWASRRPDEVYIGGRDIIPVVYPFRVEGYLPLCYFVVNLDAALIASYLSDTYLKEGGSAVVFGADGEELFSVWNGMRPVPFGNRLAGSRSGAEDGGISLIRNQWDNYILAWHRTVIAPWTIAVLKSERRLNRSLADAGFSVILLALASSALSFVMAILISRGITKPLSQLEKSIRKVSLRDFDTRFAYGYSNEVGQLGKSFNFMLDEIQDLIGRLNDTIGELRLEKERVRSEQQLKRKAELKALQAQINPHFLYNTLNSIIWLADKSGARDIVAMTENLGRLFQISLSDGRELITVGEETEHVRRYLAIQKMRYGEKLDYRIDVDEGLLDLMVVKLTLQPFVENAIYHGLREKDGAGLIEVSARLDSDGSAVLFEITDDGVGMREEYLELIRKKMAFPAGADDSSSDGDGYGIYNVNERVRLYFGESYGVAFSSVLGEGTTVRVRIPAVSRKSEARNGEI